MLDCRSAMTGFRGRLGKTQGQQLLCKFRKPVRRHYRMVTAKYPAHNALRRDTPKPPETLFSRTGPGNPVNFSRLLYLPQSC